MLSNWLSNVLDKMVGSRKEEPSIPSDPDPRRHIKKSPTVIALVGPTPEVEATSIILAGCLGDGFVFSVGSSDRLLSAVTERFFGVSADEEEVDMFLGVSGASLFATIQGAIDANHPEIWPRILEKLRDRIRPAVFVATPTFPGELQWCLDAGGVVIATPGYDGDEQTHFTLEAMDEDVIADAVETLANTGVDSVKRRTQK